MSGALGHDSAHLPAQVSLMEAGTVYVGAVRLDTTDALGTPFVEVSGDGLTSLRLTAVEARNLAFSLLEASVSVA